MEEINSADRFWLIVFQHSKQICLRIFCSQQVKISPKTCLSKISTGRYHFAYTVMYRFGMGVVVVLYQANILYKWTNSTEIRCLCESRAVDLAFWMRFTPKHITWPINMHKYTWYKIQLHVCCTKSFDSYCTTHKWLITC